MVEGVNSNGKGKEWVKINDTTQDKEYQSALDKKINSILGGKETISVEQLRKNSVFSNLSEAAEKRFNDIARMDGDGKTVSAEELRVLYSLADAKLENDQFKFDTNLEIDGNSGLEQATDKEVNVMIQNLVQSDVRKRVETIDTSKYDRTKPFSDKVQSNDVDEVMLAMQDKLSIGINKSTGKPLSIVQAATMLKQEGAESFEKKTGIKVTNVGSFRVGGFSSFTIGDWEYSGNINKAGGVVTNNKTGEVLELKLMFWENATTHTIPASNGYYTYLQSYDDGNGTKVQFEYGDDENIAPTSANVTVNGKSKTINYNPKFRIDPEVYNFLEK